MEKIRNLIRMKSRILLIAAFAGTSVLAAENLLPNSSFEIGTDRPAGWEVWAKEPAVAVWSAGNARTGSRALQIGVVTDKDGCRWIQEEAVKVTPGQKYRLTGWVKTEDVLGNANIAIGWYSKKGWLATTRSIELNRTHNWRQLAVEAEAPADAVCARINLGKRLPGAGTAWFDDLEFLPLGEEVQTSGKWTWDRALERKIEVAAGAKPIGTPLKLAVLNPDGALELVVEKDQYRIKDSMGNFSGFLSEPIPFAPDRKIELAIPYRRNGSFNLVAVLLWYDQSGAVFAAEAAHLDADAKESQIAVISVAAPAGAKELRLALLQRRSGGESVFGVPCARSL
jgi:hypothetical protein